MFARGQEIVCINDAGWTNSWGERPDQGGLPQKDKHYTCGGYYCAGFIYLLEMPGCYSFEEVAFRPLTKRKTDITVFEEIRRKQERVVKAPAKVLDPIDEDFVER